MCSLRLGVGGKLSYPFRISDRASLCQEFNAGGGPEAWPGISLAGFQVILYVLLPLPFVFSNALLSDLSRRI